MESPLTPTQTLQHHRTLIDRPTTKSNLSKVVAQLYLFIFPTTPRQPRAMAAASNEIPTRPEGDRDTQFLCLTICGYRRPGMSEADYRHHMTKVSAPMTKDLMVKYGVKRWTMVRSLIILNGIPSPSRFPLVERVSSRFNSL